MYYIYMLRCKDNSIYTGITTDIGRRLKEHLNKTYEKSKYTCFHEAKQIDAIWETENKSEACKLEYHINTLTKNKKEEIIKDNDFLKKYLFEKIDINNFKRM